MILDVQPFVKSLFCPIRQSLNGFFDSEAGGGGVKSFRSEGSKQWGDISQSHNRRSNGTGLGCRFLGRRFESWSVDAAGGAAAVLATADPKVYGRLHHQSATASPDSYGALDCLDPCVLLTKNPKGVLLCD